jgi:polysaccharide biosynthesis/export protein
MQRIIFQIAGLLSLLLYLGSCSSPRELQYMQGAFDTAKLSTYTIPEPIIQKGDLLSINVYSDNPTTTSFYNLGNSGSGSGTTSPTGSENSSVSVGAQTGSSGYLIDQDGNIQFPSLGKIHAEGLTKAKLSALLESKLVEGDFLKHPFINIRFLNFKITILGDVAHPGIFSIPTERVNLLEALGLAGDLNVSARRDNVLIIRETNGQRQFGRIDLKKTDIFNSPFYQLQQNDLIYVDLTRVKASQNDQTTIRNISLAATLISTFGIIYTVLKK